MGNLYIIYEIGWLYSDLMRKERVVEIKNAKSRLPEFGNSDLRTLDDLLALEYMNATIGIFPSGGGGLQHYHIQSEELYYIYKGEITLHVGDNTYLVGAGTALRVPPGIIHWPYNHTDKDCKIVCVRSLREENGDMVVVKK